MLKSLFTLILISNFAHAETCSDKSSPLGFGFASLDQLRDQINKSYDIKEHCKKHQEIFSNFENQKSDIEGLNKAIINSKLIILGEEHNSPSQRDYGKIFTDLKNKNNKIDCLFLEWNPNDKEAQKLINGERSEFFNYLGHLELVAAARATQTKIFAVDDRDKNTKYDPQDSGNYIRKSNLGIHKNIKQLFDSGTCKTGILLIGKAHVEHPQIQINPKDSLKTFFETDRIPVTAVNFVYTGKNEYANNIDQQWSWNTCPGTVPKPLKNQIAVSKNRLNNNEGFTINPVNSFDYYLFLPEVDSKRLYP